MTHQISRFLLHSTRSLFQRIPEFQKITPIATRLQQAVANFSWFFADATSLRIVKPINEQVVRLKPCSGKITRTNNDRDGFWVVLLAIAMVAATLANKQVEAEEEELSWKELEPLADLFDVRMPDIRDQESLKKTARNCFYAILQACLDGDWALIDQADTVTLAKLTDDWGQPLLIAATGEGNKSVVEGLINRKIALQKRDREGNTPLHVAAKNGFAHLVPVLCDRYIEDLNLHGKNSHHIAIEYGHLAVLKVLINKKPICRALKEGHLTLTLPALCIRHSRKDCLNYILKQPGYSLAERSFKLGTLLHVAVYFGQFDILKTLVGRSESAPLLQQYDDQGRNPLALAAFLGDLEAVDFLYRKVGNTCGDNGWTAAHWAVMGKQGDVLKLLAFLGMNLETRDAEGKRPKALLKEDTSDDARIIKNILNMLILNKEKIARSPLDFLSQPPEGIVFKGGGPRGLAYLEALRALKERKALSEIQRTAGTSAGAITAVIFALDPLLKDIDALENLDLMQFLDPVPGKEPLLNGMLTAKDKDGMLSKIVSGSFEVVKGAWNPLKLYHAFSRLDGICEGENLRRWIEAEVSRRTEIENCTFGELKDEIRKGKKFLHLHVFTTRLEGDPNKRILHFSSENSEWDNIVISDAIRASMSIPGVYIPYTVREKTRSGTLIARTDLGPCVDGGLVKNFPIDAFDLPMEEEYYPSFNRRTLGLCLKDVEEPSSQNPTQSGPVSGIINIAKACASVYWAVEEIYIEEMQENRHRIIEIPVRGVGLCDFNLTLEQKASLLKGAREGINQSVFAKEKQDSDLLVHMKANNLPIRLPFFTGRQEELRSLEKTLFSEIPSTNDTTVRLIYGLGGMGKTELTRAFARNHQEDFSIIWFINGATTEQKNQSYRELAEELKIPILDKELPEQITKKVHARLKNHSYEKPWLLVYDNMDKEIELPQGGYVLITSRNREAWKNEKERIELSEFVPADSLKILEDITEKRSPRMAELAKELGHFPLALNQAAHYIRVSCTIEEYLTALKKNPIRGRMTPGERYTKSLQNVWDITLKTLETEHPKACAWLKVCAYLNPDDIPQEWLSAWLEKRSGDDWDKTEITKILGDFSLIRRKDEGYSMHRLMQLVVRDSPNVQTEFHEALELVINQHHIQDLRNWKQIVQWVAQAESIERVPSFKHVDKKTQADISDRVGSSLSDLGRYQESLEYHQRALKIREEVLPINQLALARNYDNIGSDLNALGRDQESLEHHQRALKIREEVLPSNHPDIAMSNNNIGVTLRDLGRYEESLEHHQRALKIREEVLPSDHPDLATSYENIGITLGDLERHQEASQHLQNALTIREKALTSDHPDLAKSYNSIGLNSRELGRYQEALEYYQKALKIWEKVLSPNHFDLATIHNNIGLILRDLGRHQESLEHHQKTLKICEIALPSNHPNLALCYNNMGLTLRDLGRPQEALEYMKKTLELCAFFENHPGHELFLRNFITTLNKQSDAHLVEKAKQEILALYIPRLGENHQLIQELKRVQPMNSTCTIF